jgi:hypothetical protein
MAPAAATHPLRTLLRNLTLVTVLALVLYILFTIYPARFLSPFSPDEILLLEARAIVLIAWQRPGRSRARSTRYCGGAEGPITAPRCGSF